MATTEGTPRLCHHAANAKEVTQHLMCEAIAI
jgi:hypothetical protein